LPRPVESALYASIRFDAGGYSCGHIQGLPTALRELAQTLVRCAELTEQTYPAPTPAVVEGVAG
jgi:hypothetical protein